MVRIYEVRPQAKPQRRSQTKPRPADKTVVALCRDLDQVRYLHASDYQEVDVRAVRAFERKTFKRLIRHMVNLPPLPE